MSYVFTAWVCFILFLEYKSIAALRLRFLSDEKRRPDQFTVSSFYTLKKAPYVVILLPFHDVAPDSRLWYCKYLIRALTP